VRLGKSEIIRCRFRDADDGTLFTDDTGLALLPYAEVDPVTGRGKVFTPRRWWIVPAGKQAEEAFQIHLGILFDNHRLLDAFRYLACSTGDPLDVGDTYDALPQGMGAAIPHAYFDHGRFDAVQLQRGLIANGWWLEGGEELRRIAGQIGEVYGLAFLSRIHPTAGLVLSVVDALPPSDADRTVAHITQDWVHEVSQPIESRRDERKVINRVRVSQDWDPLEKKYQTAQVTYLDAASTRKYGSAPLKDLAIPWRHGDEAALTFAATVDRIFGLWGRPPEEYALPIIKPEVWALFPGADVKVTLANVPNWRDGGIGIADVVMRVADLELEIGVGAQRFGEAVVRWHAASRRGPYVPGLRLVERVGEVGAVYSVRVDRSDGGFSRVADGPDIAFYRGADAYPYWRVKIVDPTTDAFEDRLVLLVDEANHQIGFDAPLTLDLANKLTVEFQAYDAGITTAQELYLFLCDEDTFLLTNAASETREGVRYT
jgi:hypothetical protein